MSSAVPPPAAGQLIRHWIRRSGGPGRMVLVPFHSHGEALDELLTLCEAAAPALDVCAPQGPRSLDPVFSSRPPSARRAADPASGFAWYRVDPEGNPDPASFGDSLWHLEQLLLELCDASGESVLLGCREGATLALAASRALPHLLRGVIALGGEPDALSQWQPPCGVASAPALLRVEDVDPLAAAPRVRSFIESLGAAQPQESSASAAKLLKLQCPFTEH